MAYCNERAISDFPYLGPPGSLVAVPWMAGNRYDTSPTVRGGTHDLGAGGSVRDRDAVVNRRWVLGWPVISDDDLNTLRLLLRRPGPYRWLDPFEPNRLTANQSLGTDERRDPTGFSVRGGQGIVSSTTDQQHSGRRSLAWSSETAITVTGVGVNLASTVAAVHWTWAAVRPSLAHSFSTWVRASANVTLQAGIGWYSSAGALLATDVGTAGTVGAAWTQISAANKTSPATAAFGIGLVQATATTGSAVVVYLDDPQLEEGAAVTAGRLGAGTPTVAVDALAERQLRHGLREAELVLLELSA